MSNYGSTQGTLVKDVQFPNPSRIGVVRLLFRTLLLNETSNC